ncbi:MULTISPECIES: D-amino acid aminotransferase [Achromobacter]|uniref:branched-chain-amino-acid transaminase n=1 Tax=Alcaligenes xylosoxydans xylosoxydans TaxID=85698 RepID=A0A424W4A8_ALCXX|nr:MULTISPECIES: D-amino acid aminotransferase [Achromobacter]MBC9903523.1 D-amino acid aminotransferase [Achromobacter xylosoxidans]MBD0867406.1 D-amino acid aminotransferase [Achromobacter xylosoxidans]QNP88422.1 D-amino acid aminotransferase [Achromobacter xylosoxidans]RPJ88031.1 D-amino-acid transaminase [Achromobacter xylosoxidans]WLW64434.1 D-amino acid aminotransferase [Achromobacter aegrifaciens]
MSSIFHINGNLVPAEQAVIPALDRGFLFGDGVYEVIAVIDGLLLEFERHAARLARSLAEVGIRNPLPRDTLLARCRELVLRNGLREGSVYVQVTRGTDSKRDFAFPADVEPTVMMYVSEKSLRVNPLAESGVRVASVPDMRWQRRDIKSVSLIAQVLAKQAAQASGAFEALMVDADGVVTEGASSSALLVDAQGRIVVRPLSREILPGCTRAAVLALAAKRGVAVEERKFTLDECRRATELVLTSALHFVLPVIELDGQRVGTGQPGPVCRELRQLYMEYALACAL